jgi:peptidoglycan/LPS O-acetylase OafA/YrhL
MKSSNIAYSPAVAHLRALAAVLIVLYHGEQILGEKLRTGGGFTAADWHFSQNPLFSMILEGHTAVALFMVLSGFIFTWGAWKLSVDWGGFMINRLLRIYPLYVALIIVSLATRPGSFDLEGLISMLLPFGNVKRLEVGSMLTMSWAIAVEFQFYLLFPFLLMRLNRSPLRVVAAVLALDLLLRALGVLLGANAREIGYWHIVGRLDQFALGMGAAALLRIGTDHSAERARLIARVALAFAVPLSFGVVYWYHRHGGWPNADTWKVFWPPFEGLTWAAVIASYVGAAVWIPSLISKGLAWVGEISFSVYLLHFPIIDVFKRHSDLIPRWTGDPSRDALIATVLIVLPAIVIASAVTYTVIEKPFLERRRRYLRPMPSASPGAATP